MNKIIPEQWKTLFYSMELLETGDFGLLSSNSRVHFDS